MSDKHLTLGDLIQKLSDLPADATLSPGIGSPHSYRGFYDQIAFEFEGDTTAGTVLEIACGCIGAKFRGYKGGEYRMDKWTPVFIANHGECGVELTESLFRQMTERVKTSEIESLIRRVEVLENEVAALRGRPK